MFYNRQMQQEIIIQMCYEISKGNKFRAMQLGMFYNLVPELFSGDHASAEQRWKVLAQMWVKRKKSKKRWRNKHVSLNQIHAKGDLDKRMCRA